MKQLTLALVLINLVAVGCSREQPEAEPPAPAQKAPEVAAAPAPAAAPVVAAAVVEPTKLPAVASPAAEVAPAAAAVGSDVVPKSKAVSKVGTATKPRLGKKAESGSF